MGNTEKALISWYKSKEGARVAALEQHMLMRVVDGFKPYRCLELAHAPLVSSDKIIQKVNVSMRFNKQIAKENACVTCDLGSMPFASEYFDLVICCHLHEVHESHGAIISELSRVLSPGGMIVLMGINPYGVWRMWSSSALGQWWKSPTTPSKLLEIAEMCSLCEVYTDYTGFFQLGEVPKRQWEKHLSSTMGRYVPELGALYKVVLRKNVGAASMVGASEMHAAIP